MVIWPLWPLPVTFSYDHFSDSWTYLSFYHYTPSCQRSSKSVDKFLSYWGNSLKTVICYGFLKPVTLTFDMFWISNLAFLFYYTQSCQSSSKSVNDFLSYWGNSLKTVIFKLFDPCDLDFWPIFLTIQLCFLFIILYPPAKAHQNRLRTIWVIEVTA